MLVGKAEGTFMHGTKQDGVTVASPWKSQRCQIVTIVLSLKAFQNIS